MAFLDRVDSGGIELHSVFVVRHGHVVAEGWWRPYAKEKPHVLYSLTKSFTGTAVGLAWAEGLLDLDAPALSFFPEEDTASARANVGPVTVRHLLMLATGHVSETMPGRVPGGGERWAVHRFFEIPIEREPGRHFFYNNGASHLLAAIVQRVTGQPVFDYLTPRLFEPLGITEGTWDRSREGINLGAGNEVKVTTEDIAALGQLYLDRGRWNGRVILPANWVAAASRCQVETVNERHDEWGRGYGYQFWRSRHGAYRADGAYGQICFIIPEKDAVVAITAGNRDERPIYDAVWETLWPAFHDDPTTASASDEAALRERLAHLKVAELEPSGVPPEAFGATWPRRFVMEPPDQPAMTLAIEGDGATELALHVEGAHGAWQVRCGTDAALPNPPVPRLLWGGRPEPVAVRAVWVTPDTLEIWMRCDETALAECLRLAFGAGRVSASFRTNLWPEDVDCATRLVT